MNLKIKLSCVAKDYIIKVIRQLNEAEIDKETQIDMILNYVTNSFDQFWLDYELNWNEYFLIGLMQEL